MIFCSKYMHCSTIGMLIKSRSGTDGIYKYNFLIVVWCASITVIQSKCGNIYPGILLAILNDVVWPQMFSKLILTAKTLQKHDDVIKWKHFPRYWPFLRGIHRSPVNSPHKGQWRGALMFSLICVWINGWVNNREAGDLRRYRAHYDVTVMIIYNFEVYAVPAWWPINVWWWPSFVPKQKFEYTETAQEVEILPC